MYTEAEALFARSAMRAYVIYVHLAERETHPELRTLLYDLAETCKDQFDFWGRKSGVRGGEVEVSSFILLLYLLARRIFGVSLIARHIIERKERRIAVYTQYCTTCREPADRRAIEAFVARLNALIERAYTVRKGA